MGISLWAYFALLVTGVTTLLPRATTVDQRQNSLANAAHHKCVVTPLHFANSVQHLKPAIALSSRIPEFRISPQNHDGRSGSSPQFPNPQRFTPLPSGAEFPNFSFEKAHRIQWYADIANKYRVEVSGDMITWTPLTSYSNGANKNMELFLSLQGSEKFYRITSVAR